jgi:tRNA(Ile)-lysidine synthetase-like protein
VAALRHPLVGHLGRRLEGRCGVPAGERVIVGCSGGADSVALLLGAAALWRRRRGAGFAIEPIAVHVHHHLRPDADQDAALVEALARRLEVSFRVAHVEPAAESGNLAAAARRLRYAALARSAVEEGASFVAVAHHARDQLETMLMALARGAGIDGVCGMPYATALPSPGVHLVRPMLDVPPRRCADLCRAAGAGWRDDPGNRDASRRRARLRRDVIPVLEALWPGASVRAAGTAEVLRAAAQAMSHALDGAFGDAALRVWGRAELARLPLPVIAAGLRRAALHELGGPCDRLGQRQLLRAGEVIRDGIRRPRRQIWPRGLVLHVGCDTVRLIRAAS